MATVFIIFAVILYAWLKTQPVKSNLDNDYRNYIEKLGDKNFFFYNNKRRPKSFIEANILPYLPEHVEIIYLNGKKPESEYPETVVSHMLYQSKAYDGFPHLVKLRNGVVTELSINNEVSNCIYQHKNFDLILFKIYAFFDLQTLTSI